MSKATIDFEKQKFASDGSVKISGAFGGGGKTTYTQTQINTLSSSTDINHWIDAFNDGQLIKQYVQEYDLSNEKVTYYTHPTLTSGKCLKILRIYITDNSNRVLQSETPSVADWTFESNLAGNLTLTIGTITSPAVDATAGTDICSVSFSDTGPNVGTHTLALSGTNASLYQLNNTTQSQTGSTLTNVLATDTVVIETASTFTGVTFNHSITCTVTETVTLRTASQNISTNGTAIVFGNEFFVSDTWRGAHTGFIRVGNYHRNSSSDYKGMFPDLDSTTGFRTSTNVSYSFWTKFTNSTGLCALYQEHYVLSGTDQSFVSVYLNGTTMFIFSAHNGKRRYRSCTVPSDNDWHHVVITTTSADVSSGAIIYIDGAAVSSTIAGDSESDIVRNQPVDVLNFGGTLYNRLASNGTYTGVNSATGTFVMEEFSTWKKTLSASEVTELYNSGSPTDLTEHSAATDLQRWFRFGDTTGDGTVIKDSQDTSIELESYDSQDNIIQLTMNDSIYVSDSGNHKFIEDVNRTSASGSLRGNYNKDTTSYGKGWFPDLETTGSFRSSPNVSWSFWIKCGTTPVSSSNFFYEYYDTDEYFQFGMASSNRFSIYSRDGVSSSHRVFRSYSQSTIFDGNWHHICITTDTNDVSTGAVLYFDGVARNPVSGSLTHTVVRDKHTKSIALMGNNFLGNGGSHTIAMDEFSTWKKQLSASEVLSLYNGGSPSDLTQHSASADLQRWFKMGDTTGDGVNIKDSQETSFELASFDSQDNTQNH